MLSLMGKKVIQKGYTPNKQLMKRAIVLNKTRMSKVGAITKAQNAQNIFLEKNLKLSKIFLFRKMSHSAEKCKKGDPF